MPCCTVVTVYKLLVLCPFAIFIATDPVSTRSAEEVETGVGLFLEESTTRAGISLEAGSDTDSGIPLEESTTRAGTLLEGDLDIFLEELNMGSGFIQITAWIPLP